MTSTNSIVVNAMVARNALSDYRLEPLDTKEGQVGRIGNFFALNPKGAKSESEIKRQAAEWMRSKWGVFVSPAIVEEAFRRAKAKGVVREF